MTCGRFRCDPSFPESHAEDECRQLEFLLRATGKTLQLQFQQDLPKAYSFAQHSEPACMPAAAACPPAGQAAGCLPGTAPDRQQTTVVEVELVQDWLASSNGTSEHQANHVLARV